MANLFAKKPLAKLMAESQEVGEHSLKRSLGPINLIALGIGGIIGAGLFVRTAAAIAAAPTTTSSDPALQQPWAGKVTGIRMTVAGRPPSSLQKVLPRRLFLTAGRSEGTQALTAANTSESVRARW